jgi:hypothetical protein
VKLLRRCRSAARLVEFAAVMLEPLLVAADDGVHVGHSRE